MMTLKSIILFVSVSLLFLNRKTDIFDMKSNAKYLEM